jgi:hypothetical protein
MTINEARNLEHLFAALPAGLHEVTPARPPCSSPAASPWAGAMVGAAAG